MNNVPLGIKYRKRAAVKESPDLSTPFEKLKISIENQSIVIENIEICRTKANFCITLE